MSILSFDVGIINLSYCLIKKENNTPVILDWGVINICDDNIICNLCDTHAIYYNINLTNTKCYYCKSHKPITLEYNEVETKDTKCIYKNKNDTVCNKIAYYCCKNDNTNLCKIHYKQHLKNNISKTIKKSNQDYDTTIKNLVTILDNKLYLLDNTEHVIIENQPSFKNPKMKSIALTLYNYYLIRGAIDGNVKKVKFISPSNKLKLIDDIDKEKLKTIDKKHSYKLNKKLSIDYCNRFIKDDDKWKCFFNNNKKKDDLSDSLLQCLYYISINKE